MQPIIIIITHFNKLEISSMHAIVAIFLCATWLCHGWMKMFFFVLLFIKIHAAPGLFELLQFGTSVSIEDVGGKVLKSEVKSGADFNAVLNSAVSKDKAEPSRKINFDNLFPFRKRERKEPINAMANSRSAYNSASAEHRQIAALKEQLEDIERAIKLSEKRSKLFLHQVLVNNDADRNQQGMLYISQGQLKSLEITKKKIELKIMGAENQLARDSRIDDNIFRDVST